MKIKSISLTICLMLIAVTSFSQRPETAEIKFSELEHNFGEFNEEDGVVSYNFEFTNTGKQALQIQRVKPSCGCTSSEYTKKPVMPGEKGIIGVQYNPKNRPGNFTKTITIYSNAATSVVILKIKGKVNSKPLEMK